LELLFPILSAKVEFVPGASVPLFPFPLKSVASPEKEYCTEAVYACKVKERQIKTISVR